MYDVTHKPIYREHAEKWFQLMKARMRLRDNGKYFVWNYWDPSVPWDTNADGSLKHWVGVHPNGGYYSCGCRGDRGCVRARSGLHQGGHGAAHRHQPRLHVEPAGPAREIPANQTAQSPGRWANSPGELWDALAPYDPTLRKIFEANLNPGDWGGMGATPQWVARFGRTAEPAGK